MADAAHCSGRSGEWLMSVIVLLGSSQMPVWHFVYHSPSRSLRASDLPGSKLYLGHFRAALPVQVQPQL